MAFAILHLTFVDITISCSELSLRTSFAILEHALVCASISKGHLAHAVLGSFLIRAYEGDAVRQFLDSFSMGHAF